MEIINDTSIDTKKYTCLVESEDLSSYDLPINLDLAQIKNDKKIRELCTIISFKIDLKVLLISNHIAFSQYLKISSELAKLFPHYYRSFNLHPYSTIEIKPNDFVDFGDPRIASKTISLQNFQNFIDSEFKISLDNESCPDVRLTHDKFSL